MSRRNLIVAVAVIAGIAVALVLLIDLPAGDGLPRAAPTTTSTAATEPPATSSTSPTTTTTTEAVAGWQDGRYRVVGVEADDVLNVRHNPGASHAIVGTLPPDGVVELDGLSSVQNGAEWRSVVLEDGLRGWVNATFLAPPSGWEVPFGALPCPDNGAEFGELQTLDGPSSQTGAVHVLDVFTYRSDDCQRFVILLGEGLEPGSRSSPAQSVPAGASLAGAGSVIEVRIPGARYGRPVTHTVEGASFYVLATRDRPTAGEPADLTFRAFFESNVRAAIRQLENPARVVVDVRSAPTGTGLEVSFRRGGLAVVAPVQPDGGGPGVSVPIVVTGWARPFEAQGVAVLRVASGSPGTGAPVEAAFSGTDFAGEQLASAYPFTTADYIDAWGAFAFSIDDLGPGTYELFVGELSMESGEPVGVYQVFTVTG